MSESQTEISTLGEFGLIEELTKSFKVKIIQQSRALAMMPPSLIILTGKH